MAAVSRFRVKAAAAVVKLKDARTSEVYLYRGGIVPSNADPDHLKHLVSIGLVEKAAVADPLVQAQKQPTSGQGDGGQDGAGTGQEPPKK